MPTIKTTIKTKKNIENVFIFINIVFFIFFFN